MSSDRSTPIVARLLVVLPNWVGDVVLATPVLAALRAGFPGGIITGLLRPYVREVLAGAGCCDEMIAWPPRRQWPDLIRTLRARRFDAALLLTNSFSSALVAALARIPRRIGYARDGRGWLLTERLRPPRRGGRLIPTPIGAYYAALAERVGCQVSDERPRLAVTAEEEAAAAALRARHGLADSVRYALINPGAAFGAAKCWLPERFAQVCDALATEFGLLPVLVGAPGEAGLLERIARAARRPTVRLVSPGTTLGSLKPLVRDAAVLVCNDTGPRHYGNAFEVPTVTIFGPTDRRWTDTNYAGEVILQASVECGPCQLRRCPLDHRCMRGVTAEQVVAVLRRILPGAVAAPAGDRSAGCPTVVPLRLLAESA